MSDARIFGRLGFENAYAFAMRSDRARELGVASLTDLARVAPRLTVGGDPEFFERPEWIAVRDAYGLRFAEMRNFSPTFMYDALQSGEADVISAYTSDGRIAADRLTVLADPQEALPSYDALIVLSPKASRDDRLRAALEPLLGAIDVARMGPPRSWRTRSGCDGQFARVQFWVWQNGPIQPWTSSFDADVRRMTER